MTARPTRVGRRLAFLTAVLLAVPLPVLAWNGAGHRLVAAIAWDRMTAETREEAGRLLRRHPDHDRWLKRAGEQEGERGAFIEASTWPDDIRKDARFYSAGKEEPTPTLPGFPDMERRSNWHYVNIPLNGASERKPLSGQLDRQLEALAETLGDASGSAPDRAYALPWLIHLVGDVHQPLHTSARLDAEGKWDKLGNAQEIQNPFNRRKPKSTLHAFWDDLPGPPWLRGDRLEAAAAALTARHRHDTRPTSSKRWIEESWQIARDSGYPQETQQSETVPVISETFFENSREITDRRVAQAGYRLADLLNRLLAPRPRNNQR